MNRKYIAQMVGQQVRTVPNARLFKQTGEPLPEIDCVWRIERVSKGHITLFNGATGNQFDLGLDHIKEYMSDRASGLGFLMLKSQIILKGAMVDVQPIFEISL